MRWILIRKSRVNREGGLSLGSCQFSDILDDVE